MGMVVGVALGKGRPRGGKEMGRMRGEKGQGRQ